MASGERWFLVLRVVSALGCGLVAGVFFAFSSFVMGALAKLPPAQGMAAMQSINIRVLNPVFLGVFLGTALSCLALGISSILRPSAPGSPWILLGCALYILGTFAVTGAFNVPLNESLALLKPGEAGSEAAWNSYVSAWTAWNHARTLAAFLAAAILTAAPLLKSQKSAPQVLEGPIRRDSVGTKSYSGEDPPVAP